MVGLRSSPCAQRPAPTGLSRNPRRNKLITAYVLFDVRSNCWGVETVDKACLIPSRQLFHRFHHRSTLVFVQAIISDLFRLIFQELHVYGRTSSLLMVIPTQPN